VLAVKTTAFTVAAPEWNVSEAGIETANAAQRANVPVSLIRVVLAEDPPTDIVTREGMLAAVRTALCVPLQYRLEWWLLSADCDVVPLAADQRGRRFIVKAPEEKGETT
jgi:hypothetical protein